MVVDSASSGTQLYTSRTSKSRQESLPRSSLYRVVNCRQDSPWTHLFRLQDSGTLFNTPLALTRSASRLSRSANYFDTLAWCWSRRTVVKSLNGFARAGRGALSLLVSSSSPGEVKFKSDGAPELFTPYQAWLVCRGYHNAIFNNCHYIKTRFEQYNLAGPVPLHSDFDTRSYHGHRLQRTIQPW